ncbi:MAG TPA: pyrroloquinoline quinone-dependent dehydrogenase [Vicinamibacterales bacterium]|nr:pyrroloquinoline quinone-dependent dehydrogenase [Vicinamibacterales bacterium]
MRRFGGSLLIVTLVAIVTVAAQSGSSGPSRGAAKPYTTWTAYQGGAHSSQYSALDQINKSNVSQLEVAWTYPVSGNIVFNPIVVDNTMYVQGTGNAIVALDAATGKELWTRPNQGAIGARGLNYWESKDRSDRRLLYLNAGNLTAINAQTGQTITSFGNNGRVDLRVALWREARNPLQTSNPGRIFDNLMIISLPAQGAGYDATPADVQAYDVRTGKIAWVFHSIPQPGEYGYDTWPEGAYKKAGGVHNWSELTVDEQRGIVFIPFGTARFDFYGGDRAGNNLFGNSLVALDARTGKRLWHYQLVHHDLWDYDLPQAPKLLTLKQNGRNIDVVVQATKFGFVFVFERTTGKPVFPIEERPVPQSDVPGEVTSPTQPFPMKVPPFARQSFTEKDVNPHLPEAEKERLRQLLRSVRNEGLFTPPSLEGSIELPGHNGGANWGSTAVDPTKGELYVVAKNMPTLMRLVLSNEEPTAGGALGGGGVSPIVTAEQKAQLMAAAKAAAAKGPVRYTSPYDFMQSPTNGMTAIGPPWSEITAYDLNTGEIKWRIPDGGVTAPADANIPANTGAHMPRGGPLVTAGGLLFVATASDRTLRAYDRDSGKTIWTKDLPTGSEGVPATYEVSGRQFIVFPVAAGAGLFPARFGGPAPQRGGAAGGPEAEGARAGGGGRGRGGPPPLPGAYIAYALPKR